MIREDLGKAMREVSQELADRDKSGAYTCNDALIDLDALVEKEIKDIRSGENRDGTLLVPNWESIDNSVYIVVGGKITKVTLDRIEIYKNADSVKINYVCGIYSADKVHKTRVSCAEEWLEKQGLRISAEEGVENEE